MSFNRLGSMCIVYWYEKYGIQVQYNANLRNRYTIVNSYEVYFYLLRPSQIRVLFLRNSNSKLRIVWISSEKLYSYLSSLYDKYDSISFTSNIVFFTRRKNINYGKSVYFTKTPYENRSLTAVGRPLDLAFRPNRSHGTHGGPNDCKRASRRGWRIVAVVRLSLPTRGLENIPVRPCRVAIPAWLRHRRVEHTYGNDSADPHRGHDNHA